MTTDSTALFRRLSTGLSALLALTLAVGLFLSAAPASISYATGETSLVANGSFEQPHLAPHSFQYLHSIPGWDLSYGTAIELQNTISNWAAAEGTQLVELDSNHDGGSGIYQDIVTLPGAAYRLRFAFSPRPGRPASDNVMQVNWNGAQLGDLISADGSSLGNTSWSYYTFTVVATSSTTRLEFRYAGTPNSFGSFIDDVSVFPLGATNNSWVNAEQLTLEPDEISPDIASASADQALVISDQSAWYKFSVQPNSKLVVTLTNLPANYDLTLYKDIAQAYQTLTGPQDLVRLGAEFAPDSFSPDSFSPDSFSPDSFSPDSFSPDSFSPDSFSANVFAPDSFSPDSFSPDSFSPDSFSPDSFSPDSFSPDSFSPDSFSPDSFSPDSFSPDSFSSAQTRSLIGVSAFEGTAGEGLLINTWNNSGDFYVRVRGRNGAFAPDSPFHLDVTLFTQSCAGVAPITTASTTTPVAGNYGTVILTDPARMAGSASDKSALQARLASFAARPEVAGAIVDVGADARVAAANAQADLNPACPYAKNLVAESIKDIVDGFRPLNASLEYVVIVGNDDVIPFFRHPDQALLANESNYVPPVRDNTASQASLKLGYVLSQDRYGARFDVSVKGNTLPIADLAVGRLVETASDATAMLDAYLSTSAGVVPTPSSALVTGYDFLEDSARAVRTELEAGLGVSADALIADRNVSPADPSSWTADQLRALLLGSRHDLIFLAGHFSAGSALAADYSTRLLTAELLSSPVNLQNAIIFSAGCHAGYNIVDAHDVTGVTLQPDWAQAFARKQATLIAGTGYQYGDTDFIEYSERLYLDFSQQLRVGSGPVSIGKALLAAKQKYLADTAELRGIHEKAWLEATLFGLPMLSINMPAGRFTPVGDTPIVPGTSSFTSDPGALLGLSFADVSVTPMLTLNTQVLTSVVAAETVTTTYLSGSGGVVANPTEPILPREVRNVSVNGTVLRGVGFRGGAYTDLPGVLPLTGAATTEIRGVHAPFVTSFFYPVRPWSINYFGALTGASNAATRLVLLPAQFRSDSAASTTGTLRRFDSMDFRLYYSNNTTTFPNSGNTPALSAAPSISFVSADENAGDLQFLVQVVGDPAAGIQEVWVTYTALSGPYAGAWQSLDLTQSAVDSTLWQGVLDLNGTPAADIRYMVQAVNGVGLVSLSTNFGAYYVPGIDPGATSTQGQPTVLTLQSPPASGAYGTEATFSAVLTSEGAPLAGRAVTFGLGPQRRTAATDANGVVSATLSLRGLPGLDTLRASFAGDQTYQASSTSSAFTITQRATVLTLSAPASSPLGGDTGVLATLSDDGGRPLIERTVIFIVNGSGGSYAASVITDYAGRAFLGAVPLPVGTYTIDAYFGGNIPLPGQPLTLNDERYTPATASGVLTLVDALAEYVVLGQEGVYVKSGTTIYSGTVAANTASSGPYLADQAEVTLGQHVEMLDPNSAVKGDTVFLKIKATVYNASYNELSGNGTILGTASTPLTLPLVSAFPAVPAITPTPGNDVDVPQHGTATLDAGSYGLLKVRAHSTITFSGGVYDFEEWDVGQHVDLIFLAPSQIRVADKIAVDAHSTLLPAAGSGLDASDIVIIGTGQNGDNGNIHASPDAIMLGQHSTIAASVYAPNGTLYVRTGATITGAFLGRWVVIGQNVEVRLQSGF